MTNYHDPRLCLALTTELDVTEHPHLHNLTQSDHDEAADVVSRVVGLISSPDGLKVLRVQSEEYLDFDGVHSSPFPKESLSTPMVVQFFFSPDTTKVYGRVCVNLQKVDGVSGLHTMFNVMEHFEHMMGSGASPDEYLTKSKFNSANLRPGDFDQSKLDAHLKMLGDLSAVGNDGKEEAQLSSGPPNKPLPVGPSRTAVEDSLKPRVYMRYASRSVGFKEFVALASRCQDRLQLPYCAYTVNYAPSLGLGRVPEIADTLDHEKRVAAQFVPVAAPAPMDLEHAAFISYMLFWNNYGRHSFSITSEVKAVVWNWTGLPKCFTPVAFCVQIQGQCFCSTSFAEKDWEACKDILEPMDGGRPFAECPQPVLPPALGGAAGPAAAAATA